MTKYHRKKHPYKKKRKIGNCFYHLCDKKAVELFKCKYCGEYFCKEHLYAKIPQAAPFKSTDIERQMGWRKKGGHPCLSYFYYKTSKEKEPERLIIPQVSKPKPVVEHLPTLPILESGHKMIDEKSEIKENNIAARRVHRDVFIFIISIRDIL